MGFVIDKIDMLQNGQRTDFANDSGEQTVCYFCIVSNDQKLLGQLWKKRFNSFSCFRQIVRVYNLA